MRRHPALVVHVPHASRHIPAQVRNGILLDDELLEHELDLMTDSFTDQIARRAIAISGVPALVVAAPVSRLVGDVERIPDDREPMNTVGMGAVYTRTHDLRPLREHPDPTLLDGWFHPHAANVTAAVDAALRAHGAGVLLDVHSYPSERLPYELASPDDPRPQVCLGTDPTHTPSWLIAEAVRAFDGLEIGLDTPFAGTYVPLAHYGTDPRVVSLMIELRRDIYMTETPPAPHAGLTDVATRLAQLLTALHHRVG